MICVTEREREREKSVHLTRSFLGRRSSLCLSEYLFIDFNFRCGGHLSLSLTHTHTHTPSLSVTHTSRSRCMRMCTAASRQLTRQRSLWNTRYRHSMPTGVLGICGCARRIIPLSALFAQLALPPLTTQVSFSLFLFLSPSISLFPSLFLSLERPSLIHWIHSVLQ